MNIGEEREASTRWISPHHRVDAVPGERSPHSFPESCAHNVRESDSTIASTGPRQRLRIRGIDPRHPRVMALQSVSEHASQTEKLHHVSHLDSDRWNLFRT